MKVEFYSKKYHASTKSIKLQDKIVKYFGFTALVAMIIVLLMLYSRSFNLFGAISSFTIAFLLAVLLAYIDMKTTYAKIIFVDDAFAVVSEYELAFGKDVPLFPKKFATPQFIEYQLEVQYSDRIIRFSDKNWDNIPEIHENFLQKEPPTQTITIKYS